MTQGVFNTIDPEDTSGPELAALLVAFKDAILSGHAGDTAPAYATQFMGWWDTSASPYVCKLFDGSDWIPFADMNPSTNVVRLYHAGSVLGALATRNTVLAEHIESGAVTTNKYGNASITQQKMAAASVGAAQIKAVEAQGILEALLANNTLNHVLKGTSTGYTVGLPPVAAASDDTAPGYLSDKVIVGSLLEAASVTSGGSKKLRIKLANGTPGRVIGFGVDGLPVEMDAAEGKSLVINTYRVLPGSPLSWSKPAGLVGIYARLIGGGGGGGGYSNSGTAGGTTSLGTLMTATGGGGGQHSQTSTRNGGVGGTATGGDVNVSGRKGSDGYPNGQGLAHPIPGPVALLMDFGKGGDSSYNGSAGMAQAACGGDGSYSEGYFEADDFDTTETFTCGAGGARGSGSGGGYINATAGTDGLFLVTEYIEV